MYIYIYVKYSEGKRWSILENIRGRFRGHVGKVVLIVAYVNKLLISYFEQILQNIRPSIEKKFHTIWMK